MTSDVYEQVRCQEKMSSREKILVETNENERVGRNVNVQTMKNILAGAGTVGMALGSVAASLFVAADVVADSAIVVANKWMIGGWSPEELDVKRN